MAASSCSLSRLFSSKLEIVRVAKANPGIVLALDGGDGWVSHWVSDGRGKAPRSVGLFNPQGSRVS